jgi:hypothetical protein
VQKVRLSDGTVAVIKKVDPDFCEDPDEAENEYLCGLVATALGIPGVVTARLGDHTTLTQFVHGRTAIEHRKDAGEIDDVGAHRGPVEELKRITNMRNGREIGLLDFLTNNLDRNGDNYLVNGDVVTPIDHASCVFHAMPSTAHDHEEMDSPFARAHLHARCDVTDNDLPPDVPASELVSPFRPPELAQLRANLAALEPEFTAHNASAKHAFLMQQLAKVEAAALRERHWPHDENDESAGARSVGIGQFQGQAVSG